MVACMAKTSGGQDMANSILLGCWGKVEWLELLEGVKMTGNVSI